MFPLPNQGQLGGARGPNGVREEDTGGGAGDGRPQVGPRRRAQGKELPEQPQHLQVRPRPPSEETAVFQLKIGFIGSSGGSINYSLQYISRTRGIGLNKS